VQENALAALRGQLLANTAALAVGRQQIADDELAAQSEKMEGEARRQTSALEAMEQSPGEKLDAINARIKRLEAAEGNHRKAVSELNQEIARLQALIEANEGIGVDEASEVAKADQLRIDAQVKGFEQEAAVLRLLLDTLRTAETEANPRSRLPIQSRTLRQKAAKAAAQTNRRLDKSANPKVGNSSLNSNPGCLKVVDTFRHAHFGRMHQQVKERASRWGRRQKFSVDMRESFSWKVVEGAGPSLRLLFFDQDRRGQLGERLWCSLSKPARRHDHAFRTVLGAPIPTKKEPDIFFPKVGL
jgi:hypothetical protein